MIGTIKDEFISKLPHIEIFEFDSSFSFMATLGRKINVVKNRFDSDNISISLDGLKDYKYICTMKITSNRKAYFEYSVLASFDAGIILIGNEVKSIRRNDVSIADSFIYIKDGELFVKNMKVAKYKQSHALDKHEENREKKLLLNRKEIDKIEKLVQGVGTTIIPLEIFVSRNLIKVKIGVCKGKKLWNKKEDIKARDIDRDSKRELNDR